MLIYSIIDEIIKINRTYPAIYDLFCIFIMFSVAYAYNIFKRRNLTNIGILLSTILTYSVLYTIIRVKIFGIKLDHDMKLIVSVFSGFLSIEFFEKFNPVAITDYFIRIAVDHFNKEIRTEGSYLKNFKERSERYDTTEKKADKIPSEDKMEDNASESKDTFRETK